MTQINVIPYIDVMLVLLVLFLVIAPNLEYGLTVKLPQAAANPIDVKGSYPVLLIVKSNGDYFLQEPETKPRVLNDLQDLSVYLKGEKRYADQQKRNLSILIRGDREVPYGRVATLIGELKRSGIDQLALVTESRVKS